MRLLYLTCLIALVLTVSSCSYKQNQLLFQNLATTDSLQQGPVASSYLIQAQDILQVRNLQSLKYIVDEVPPSTTASGPSGNTVAAQGQTYQVEEDGTVTLPALGHIQVAGLTRPQATKLIEDLYRKTLLKDPIIELKVVNLKVTLLGEVKAPGNFPLTKDNTTLVEIIGQAGGLTPQANEKNVKIIRGKNKNQVTIINLGDLSSITDPRTILQNGDVIYVAQNKRAIRNDNLQSFSSWAQPALLLLNTALIIFTLSRQ